MNLYELVGRWASLRDRITDTGLDEEAVRQELEQTEGDLAEKMDNYGAIIRELMAGAESLRNESARLSKRAAALDKRAATLRDWLLWTLRCTGRTKLQTPHFSYSVSAAPSAVLVTDLEKALNSGYLKEPKMDESMLDKAAMRRDLEAGLEIPGVELKRAECLRMR